MDDSVESARRSKNVTKQVLLTQLSNIKQHCTSYIHVGLRQDVFTLIDAIEDRRQHVSFIFQTNTSKQSRQPLKVTASL